MSLLRRNILANLSGRLVTAALGFLFVPIIVRLIGIESYGLVAFFTSLQALFSLLDLGLSATITRELARLSAEPGRGGAMRDMVRTLEVCYWGIALVIAVCMLALTPAVVHWVSARDLPPETIRQAVLIMGLVMALQWPLSFYEGGLVGLQRQVAWNTVSVSMGAARQIGAVLVLWLVSPTVQAYLLWQVLTSGLQTGLTALLVWRHLPAAAERARFRRPVLATVWRFAAGITGTSIVSLGLSQMDKLVLSRVLPLDEFGYYSLAAVAAGGLHYLIGPIYSAAFPRFSQLVAAGDETTLRREYHRIAQFAAVIVLSAAVVLILFAPQILQLWLRDAGTVAKTHRLVSLLAAGTVLNALIHVPYALQLASGWTTLMMYTNAIALVVLAPATYLLARTFGAAGAAAVWILLNATYVLVNVPLMHRRLLAGEQWRWYAADLALPLAGSLLGAGLWRSLVHPGPDPILLGLFVAAVSVTTLASAGLATPATRHMLQGLIGRRWPGLRWSGGAVW